MQADKTEKLIAPASIQEVMNRADIVEVVEQFVRLKKRGANYIANCPFHNEKSPSFSVSASKGIFKCFGCGKGGNAVTFVQEHEKISYPEAIRWLADFYKIPLEETKATEEQIQNQQVEESLRLFNEFAATYFTNTLLNTEEGQTIGLSYFKERGFRGETIEKFRLGYCPEDGSSFYKEALAKGYTTDLMEKSGLVKNANGRWYDTYRGRVIFPIQNLTGRVLGFGARILKSNDKAPKYINSPENELYNKSRVLYGLFQSRQAMIKNDECYLVEGYTDVISLHQGGVGNVVASSGTSLTEDQLRIIGRTTKNLTILYAGDPAGIKAAMRGLDMALSQSFNVQLALLPEGQDPDSYIQSVGASEFEAYVKSHKRDVVGFRMEVGMKEAEHDPVKKSKLVNEIAETISRINKAEDFSLQDHYIKQASELLQVEEGGLINLVNKFIRERVEQEKRTASLTEEDSASAENNKLEGLATYDQLVQANNNKDEEQEWQLVKVLILHGNKEVPDYAHAAALIYDRIDPEIIDTPEVKRFYNLYFDYLNNHQQLPNLHYFTNHPDPSIQIKSATLVHQKNEVSPKWLEVYGIALINGEENYLNDIESSLGYFELKKLKALQNELQKKLASTTEEHLLMELLQQFMMLKKTEQEILQRPGTVIVKSASR